MVKCIQGFIESNWKIEGVLIIELNYMVSMDAV